MQTATHTEADEPTGADAGAAARPVERGRRRQLIAAAEPLTARQRASADEHARNAGSDARPSDAPTGSVRLILERREMASVVDPLAVFAAASGRSRAYWAAPDRDVEFAAVGCLFETRAAGADAADGQPDRFAAAQRQLDAVSIELVGDDGPVESGPVFIGGFAFSDGSTRLSRSAAPWPKRPVPGAARGPDWSAFGAGRLRLPEVLVTRVGDRCWLTLAPGADVSVVALAARAGRGGEQPNPCADCGTGVCARAPADAPPSSRDRDSVAPTGLHAAADCTAPTDGGICADRTAAAGPANRAGHERSPLHPAVHAQQVDDDGYLTRVARALDDIGSGRLLKVVTARPLQISGDIDVIGLAGQLRERQRSCVTFAFGDGETVFLGATPELLVRCTDGVVATEALAGSRPRGADASADAVLREELLGNAKERSEHAYVVADICDALAAAGVEATVEGPATVVRLRHIQHLCTPVTGRAAPSATALDLVAALHPTAAVAGLPRSCAQEWIAAHEDFDRGWYCGPVGWTAPGGDGEFRVALRCALADSAGATLFAGGGIVAGADPAAELAETHAKLEALLDALTTC